MPRAKRPTGRVPRQARKKPVKREVLESTVEGRLQQIVVKYGGEALKMTGYKGIPDRLIIVNGYYLWCEVKRRSGKTSHEQDLWLAKIRNKLKAHVVVIYGLEELHIIRHYCKLMSEAERAPFPTPWKEDK